MGAAPIRVLVVDDSAFARKVVRECLSVPGIEVVGVACDGLEALELIHELKPEVVTVDLEMPNLDGLGLLQALSGKPGPRVVVVSTSDGNSARGLAALLAGAFEVVHKPTALAEAALYEIGAKLIEVVKAAAQSRAGTAVAFPSGPAKLVSRTTSRELLVVGASTGGPQALTRLVCALPKDFPVPVALVLHIPPGYTAAFAARLDEACELEVVEASDGASLQPGRVIVARAGRHLKLTRMDGVLRCKLDRFPLESEHRPSVDVLFESAAEVAGAATLGVVLTGMGEDGLMGSKAIRAAGGSILTEAERSCVVYGMPRAVKEAGLSNAEAPIEQLAEEIIRFL